MKKAPKIDKPTHDYAGFLPCGCCVQLVSDLRDKSTADAVAEMIKDGLAVQRVPLSEAAIISKKLGCIHQVEDKPAVSYKQLTFC